MTKSIYILAAAVGAMSANAQAAGFEKSVFWSGKQAGYAGAGISTVGGSQSVYFNPAGLAGSGKGDVSLNFSPSNVKLTGNVISTNREEETDHNFSPIGGITGSYKVNDKLGVGLGVYVAAGNKSVYDSVDLTGDSAAVTAFKPRVATEFAVMEHALGAGYEVMPGLKIGAAWRILKATGSLATIKKTVTNTAYTYVNLTDLKDTKYNGFRVGVQYQSPDDSWGAGARFRNQVKFAAQGGGNNGRVVTVAGTEVNATVSDATVGTSLPTEIAVGGNYRLTDTFRLMSGVDYVKYSQNEQLSINATITSAALGVNPVTLPSIPLKWEDMWNIRLGGEYTGFSGFALRGGYSLTTRVTSKDDARATITPAGLGHLFTAGAGTSILGDSLDLDGAFEYSFNSGSGAMSATSTGSTTKELLTGVSTETKAKVMALHMGATYKF